MSGLDKMKSQILEDANAQAEERIAQANAQAEEIQARVKAEVEEAQQRMDQKTKTAVKNYHERIASSCDMKRKTAVLKAKQEMISEVLQKAYEKVMNLSDTEYFELLTNLLKTYVQSDDGEIYFSEKDKQRIPASFVEETEKIAASKGGKLTFASETKQIDGGFILVYGGIEENCTIRAIFESKRDEWSDLVQKVMFV